MKAVAIWKKLVLGIASAGLLSLYGCGGGGGGNTAAVSIPALFTVSGVAATGAAFTDGVVKVIDSTGAQVGTSSPVGANGIFNITLLADAKPPFVLVASRTTADGQVQSLVSVLASTSQSVANITPITNLIASGLSPSGNPLKLSAELASGKAQISPAAVANTVAAVKKILATLLTATGTADADPLTAAFAVDGTGYDRLLDSIQINITPASSSSSNIEISVKQALPDGTQPVAVQFSSSDTSPPPPLPAVTASSLVASGTSVRISDMLKSFTACYATPLADRVSAGGTTTASITANACKNVFFGNNPASFLSNGRVVGLNAAFNGIFTSGGTGVVFSQGSYEFTTANGDLVIGFKAADTAGNEIFDTLVVRLDTDGKLKAVGNRYTYPGGIAPYHQLRQFITLNQSNRNYYSSGYDVNIADVKTGTGVGGSIFDRVVVTTPRGNSVTYKPSVGSSNLNILLPNLTVSGTSYIRLRSVFADDSVTGDIAAMEPNLVFANPQFLDSEMAAIPGQGVWRFDYYLASAPTVIDQTQYYKTRNRALTIAELKLQGLAQLSANVISDLQASAEPLTSTKPGQVALPTNGPAGDISFTVPAGALPVTSIKIFGRMYTPSPGLRFDDEVRIGSTLRTAKVPCSPASVSDTHCGTVAGSFAAGAFVNGLHLYSRDASGRGYASFYALYKLP